MNRIGKQIIKNIPNLFIVFVNALKNIDQIQNLSTFISNRTMCFKNIVKQMLTTIAQIVRNRSERWNVNCNIYSK